jgi:hypothetical protein
MDDIAQSKPGLLQQLPLPAELGSLGSDEIEQLEKGLVRRLDTCLLPSVVILFLMNILDRYVLSIPCSSAHVSTN